MIACICGGVVEVTLGAALWAGLVWLGMFLGGKKR